MRKSSRSIVLLGVSIIGVVAICIARVLPVAAEDGKKSDKATAYPGALFSAPLPDMPGKNLVVLSLKLPPKAPHSHDKGHRHPGSVYVYVTEGTARLGIEGQPVQEVPKGGSFFEPPGALHTVTESASATEPASVIAVMIVPEGAPLVLPADSK